MNNQEISKTEFKFTKTILFRLTSIVVLLVVLSFSLGIFGILQVTKKELTQIVNKQLLAFSKYIAEDINIELTKGFGLFRDVSKRFPPEYFNSPELIKEWFDNFNIPPVFRDGMIIMGPDGTTVLAGRSELLLKSKALGSDKQWFKNALKTGSPVLSRVFQNYKNDDPFIIYAVALKDSKGNVGGVLASPLDLLESDVFSRLGTARFGKTGGVLVVSPVLNTCIACNMTDEKMFKLPSKGVNAFHDRVMAGYRGIGITSNSENKEILLAVTSVVSAGWYVSVHLELDEAYQPLTQLRLRLYRYAMVFCLCLIAVIIVIFFIFFRPLEVSAKAIDCMASGETELHKLEFVRADEVGNIIHGFNNLVDTINERTKKLEQARKDLEMSLAEVKKLSGLLPICSYCKKVRDDTGYWTQIERYIQNHSEAMFSHGICQECAEKHFPDLLDD